jgi:membrane-associated PAP2 superfamily phosphatase
LLAHVLHDDAKYAAWLFTLALCAAVIWPVRAFGSLARLPFVRRLQLPVTALLATALISGLKMASKTSCPWDLAEFGGVGHYLSHWSGWIQSDGGSGRCFPAGHASTGFAFIGGFFALRAQAPRIAGLWLATALAAGLLFGGAQQLRGAHFMSHTLWTAWLCWVVAWATDPLFARRAAHPGSAHDAPPVAPGSRPRGRQAALPGWQGPWVRTAGPADGCERIKPGLRPIVTKQVHRVLGALRAVSARH